MQGDATSLDDIGAEVVTLLDAPAADEGTPAVEAIPAVVGDNAAEAGTTDGTRDDGEPAAPAEPADFLEASGVSLEDFLEGVEDPTQRALLENSYKSMQAHWTRRNQEMSTATKAGKAALTENEELKARLAALEQRAPQPVPQPQAPKDFRQEYIHQGLGKIITEEEAIESPLMLAQFVRQQSVIAARENMLPMIDVVNRRVQPLEGSVREMVSKENVTLVDNLFSKAPHLRTPEVEAQMVSLMEANPMLPLEVAFNAVVAPLLATDAFSVGQRAATVSARRSAEEQLAAKQRASVPSGTTGNAGAGDDDLPAKPTLDDAFAFAQRSMNGQ
jgi:hypothetical protein